jgi:hypothetical protein
MKNDEDKEQIIDLTVNTIFFSIYRRAIMATIQNLGCENLQMIC